MYPSCHVFLVTLIQFITFHKNKSFYHSSTDSSFRRLVWGWPRQTRVYICVSTCMCLAVLFQRLQDFTIKKNTNYARFNKNHPFWSLKSAMEHNHYSKFKYCNMIGLLYPIHLPVYSNWSDTLLCTRILNSKLTRYTHQSTHILYLKLKLTLSPTSFTTENSTRTALTAD